MTTRRILIWNIEQFGAWQKSAKGSNGVPPPRVAALQLPFIAEVVRQMNADVLVIQEFRRNGRHSLPALRAQLNARRPGGLADWHFDFIPSAVGTAAPSAGGPAVTRAGLRYGAAANSEGYAVLFRAGVLDSDPPATKLSFGMDGNVANPGYMRLVLESQAWDVDSNANPPIVLDAAAPAPPPWSEANFPRSANADIGSPRVTKRRRITQNQWIASWNDTRRPVYMTVLDTGAGPGGGNGNAGLLVYHAPVNANSNYYGTLLAGFSQQLRSAGGARHVVGGDFNLVSAPHLANGFSTFTGNAMNAVTNVAGAAPQGMTLMRNGYQRSAVKYWRPAPAQVVDEARDQVLVGNDGNLNGSGYVVDLVTMLTTPANGLPQRVFADGGIGGAVASPNLNRPQTGAAPWGMSSRARGIAGIYGDLAQPWGMAAGARAFGSATTAAVFIYEFISDHLPLYAQIDV